MYDRAITRFKEWNDLIVQWTKSFSDRDPQTLVVCTRTLQIYILEALIKQAVDPDKVLILFSRDSSGQRDETFEWFKATPGAVLITPLVKEGVSINEIRAGVIADYVADFDVATQILGRFVRKKPTGDNRAEIAWFVDNQAPTYRRGCNSLFRQLESLRGGIQPFGARMLRLQENVPIVAETVARVPLRLNLQKALSRQFPAVLAIGANVHAHNGA